jgi:excisionase family DNA binding protein
MGPRHFSLSDERTPRGEIMSNLMTEDQVSKRLNVSVASLRRWRLLNRGPQFVKVGSLVRYQPEELDAWLASLPTGGTATTVRPQH